MISLVRHAESAANAGQATLDPSLIPLTENGWRQAEALSREIIQAPDLIITSPFARAIDTSKPTVARYPDTEVQIWNIGEFTYLDPVRCAGTTVADRRASVESFWAAADPDYVDGPGAESFSAFIDRARAALEGFCSLNHGALVFGHGQVMQAMRWLHQRAPGAITADAMREFRQYDLTNPINNCQVIVLEMQ
ncbi:Histidine phosphatase superfamily [compost metagenome]